MSQLDEILSRLGNQSNSGVTVTWVDKKLIGDTKRLIKEMIEEIIGEDEDAGVFEDGSTGEVIQNLEAFAHNNLRAELRRKVEAL